MCVPILRSIASELTKLENVQQLYILFDVYDFQFKSYGSNSGFRVFSDLDLDL